MRSIIVPYPAHVSAYRQQCLRLVFKSILTACVEAGMVSGHTQVVDAAFVEANASTDSLKRKALLEWQLLKGQAEGVTPANLLGQNSSFTTLAKTDKPKSCSRNNRSHISMSDVDAKLTQKRGKPSRLYYLSSMSVDTSDVLCHPFAM